MRPRRRPAGCAPSPRPRLFSAGGKYFSRRACRPPRRARRSVAAHGALPAVAQLRRAAEPCRRRRSARRRRPSGRKGAACSMAWKRQVVLPGLERLAGDERGEAGDRARLPDDELVLSAEAGGGEEGAPVEARRRGVEVARASDCCRLRRPRSPRGVPCTSAMRRLELEDARGAPSRRHRCRRASARRRCAPGIAARISAMRGEGSR